MKLDEYITRLLSEERKRRREMQLRQYIIDREKLIKYAEALINARGE